MNGGEASSMEPGTQSGYKVHTHIRIRKEMGCGAMQFRREF